MNQPQIMLLVAVHQLCRLLFFKELPALATL